MDKRKIINQKQDWALQCERNTLKALLMLALLGITVLSIIGNWYSGITLVILVYPAYYWLRVLYYNAGKVIYCRDCGQIILHGLQFNDKSYCSICVQELAEQYKRQTIEHFLEFFQGLIVHEEQIRIPGRIGP